ncbi:MAG: hypothetical protein QXY42_05885 [Candidatus Bathyarchaeia archaeon]
MVEIWLPYGDTEVFVNVPTERLLGFFEFQAPQGGVSIQSILGSAIPALSGARNVSLAIDSELIRSEECMEILRALGDSLSGANFKAFTNADGPLPDLPGLEWRRGGSPDRPFEDLGRTGHGNKVRIDRDFHRSDRKVLLGRLERDPIRGREWVKGLLECVASPETARANAALALEWDPKTGAERNPSYLDGCECAKIIGIDYALFFIGGVGGRFVYCAQGGFEEALRIGEEKYGQLYSKAIGRKAKIAISSAGGAPNDLCFESASRSIFNVLGGLEVGGAILSLAECRGGVGNAALIDAFARYRDKERLRRALEEEPSEAGIHSYLLMRVFEEFRVLLVSAIPEALLRPLKIKAFRSANSALESATRALGEDSLIYAIANASKNFLSLAAGGGLGGGLR